MQLEIRLEERDSCPKVSGHIVHMYIQHKHVCKVIIRPPLFQAFKPSYNVPTKRGHHVAACLQITGSSFHSSISPSPIVVS